jgi:hypothetical protein
LIWDQLRRDLTPAQRIRLEEIQREMRSQLADAIDDRIDEDNS